MVRICYGRDKALLAPKVMVFPSINFHNVSWILNFHPSYEGVAFGKVS